jgi:CheY-like chemotaxis protein
MKTVATPRILVIDDNRAIHADFRKILCPPATSIDREEAAFFAEAAPVEMRPSFEVNSAFQGEEGVNLVREALAEGRPYSVAFVDVRMPPGIDGVETTEWLWEISRDLQVVICTAFSDYSWEQMLQRLGSSDRLLVLKKPFASIEALQMACALSEKWRLTQEMRRKLDAAERIGTARKLQLQAANERVMMEIKERRSVEQKLEREQGPGHLGGMLEGLGRELHQLLALIQEGLPLLPETPGEARDAAIATLAADARRAAGMLTQLLTCPGGSEGARSD